ncbi:MAG: hypothetical protein M3Z17_02515 [Gemmatimonadota bacterium]|nr:hypothetical protein [Gemmatimonadota bacterium]
MSPALSPDEWVEFGASNLFFEKLASGGRPFGPNRRFSEEQKLLALAALALHRHPAVFTHQELDAVQAAATYFELNRHRGDSALATALNSLHQKIAALIPPPNVKLVRGD